MYIAYSATAEWSYFLSSSWDLPRSIIDLYPERSLEINGRKDPDGTRPSRKLLGAMEAHGIGTRDEVSKDLNIQLILRGAPYTAQERERILDYCEEDVSDTIRLFDAMFHRWTSSVPCIAVTTRDQSRTLSTTEFLWTLNQSPNSGRTGLAS